ncbi:MAG: DUF4113 domain-containing protein [Acidobacteria bacterium]|nr:DUF4113 domain-containing protein [Acidobacteriota bacterium]
MSKSSNRFGRGAAKFDVRTYEANRQMKVEMRSNNYTTRLSDVLKIT